MKTSHPRRHDAVRSVETAPQLPIPGNDFLLRLGDEVLKGNQAGKSYRHFHLFEVLGAIPACPDMALESASTGETQGAFDVVRDQFDRLPTGKAGS